MVEEVVSQVWALLKSAGIPFTRLALKKARLTIALADRIDRGSVASNIARKYKPLSLSDKQAVEELMVALPDWYLIPEAASTAKSIGLDKGRKHPQWSEKALFMLRAVCAEMGVSESQVFGGRRPNETALARQTVGYFLRNDLNKSFGVAGDMLDVDHGTVIHGCKRVQNEMEIRRDFSAMISRIRQKVAEAGFDSVAGGK